MDDKKEVLCVTEIVIKPSLSTDIMVEKEEEITTIKTKTGVVVNSIVSQVDMIIKGILTNGKNFQIVYHDPKDVVYKYEE